MSISRWLIVPIAMNIVQLRDNSISIFLFSDYFECSEQEWNDSICSNVRLLNTLIYYKQFLMQDPRLKLPSIDAMNEPNHIKKCIQNIE